MSSRSRVVDPAVYEKAVAGVQLLLVAGAIGAVALVIRAVGAAGTCFVRGGSDD
ncbi:hypothetical protein U6G28_11485 [Actinomycetaceae bacterium MB13-C1-2]|nr:hypothetical protein U6G28_11485 [Actinomycetaceae bacterium MB13-C1-2]